ncbi:F-box/kelch-repeat protein, partial [Trifolium medium]|nr:F-box/kelch-repeat protein [Trifolium medium]
MIQDFPYGIPLGGSGRFVSGTVNWLASNDLASNDLLTSWVIVSLDLDKESYQEITQP